MASSYDNLKHSHERAQLKHRALKEELNIRYFYTTAAVLSQLITGELVVRKIKNF